MIFGSCDAEVSTFTEASLVGASLMHVNGCDFTKCDLSQAHTYEHARANFTGAKMPQFVAHRGKGARAIFVGADLTKADFRAVVDKAIAAKDGAVTKLKGDPRFKYAFIGLYWLGSPKAREQVLVDSVPVLPRTQDQLQEAN